MPPRNSCRRSGRADEGFVDLPSTVARSQGTGLELIGLVAASVDDWDRYESLHWRAAVDEIAAGADETFVMTHHEHVDRHLRVSGDQHDWATFIGRSR